MKNADYIETYFREMKEAVDRITRKELDEAIELLFDAWKRGKRVFMMGNGGSASTATHFVCDLAKGTIVGGKKRFKVIGLTDNIPLVSALTNDDGWDSVYSEQLEALMEEGDVLVGFSVHGGSGQDKAGLWSQNLTKAIALAKERGGKTIGFTGFDGGAMGELCDVCVNVPVESTPYVESIHIALEHLISNCLREKIEKE